MSWIPFKIGQPKKQIVPKTVERDFEREYGKLQQLEEQTKRLQKDMKKSTDADLAMSKSAVKISLDLLSNPLCEQDQDFLNMVTALDTAMKRMDAFNQEKVNQIQKTVIEPLKKFGSVFPSLNMAVKRREQALQDYRRLQAKVEKYEEKEKTGPVLAKLHQAREELRPVRDDFEAKNKQLLDEMPRFYNSRLDYFQPSFESLIRAQVVYYSEMHSWDHIYLQKGSLGSPPPTLPFHLRLTFSGRGCDTALECLPALRLSPLLAFGSPAGETLSLTASLEAGTQRV
uniref:Bridging integrator 3 n=1 Tax=Bos mutus grunniens TaxID=30521 RepID=A0A8B9XH00_BOSMU